ncbi:MAG: hypothetical protein ACLP9L_40765, partial [Thermoguttaceae bacterium]
MYLLGLLCFALPVAIFLLWLSQKATGASQRASVSAAYARRGVGLYTGGDHDNAIAAFTESLLVNPKNVAALAGRGGAYLERKEYAAAVADLTCRAALEDRHSRGASK